MKKTLIALLCFIAIFANAQTSNKESVLDSIANSIMRNRGINLIETCLNVRSMYSRFNDLAIEASLYKTQKEALIKILEEVYNDNTAEELNALLQFVNSNAYACINSYNVIDEYMSTLILSAITNSSMHNIKNDMLNIVSGSRFLNDVVHSYFAGTSLNKKDFKIKDKEFIQLYDTYYEVQNKEIITNQLSRYIAKIYENRNLDISRTDVLNEARILYSSIQRNIIYRYITKQEMAYLSEFYTTPVGKKFTDYKIYEVLNIYATDRIGTADAEMAFKNNLNNFKNEDYADYLSFRKEMKLRTFEPLKNIQTIEFKKGTYNGTLSDGKPHGYGIYTDKKGVKYAGNFVEGKMHGCMTIYQQNGDSLREMWANGKKMKEQSVEKPKDGFVKAPPTYTDELGYEVAMGYGYKTSNGITNIGMFVDDVLHGEGAIYKNNIENIGIFDNGEFIKGDIIVTKNNSEKHFKGTISNLSGSNSNLELRNGIYKETNGADSTVITFIGDEIINYWYNGEGEFQYHNQKAKYSYKRKGYFAYDELFGEGVEIYESKNSYRNIYKGEFINTEKNGKGTLVIESINIFNSTFTSYYKDMQFYTSEQKLTATLEGTFNNDKLTDGKIILSCGDIFEGKFNNGKLVEGHCNAGDNSSNLIELNRNERYNGEIKAGKPHGNGILTTSLGGTHEGVFENGKLVKGSIKSSNGRIIRKL